MLEGIVQPTVFLLPLSLTTVLCLGILTSLVKNYSPGKPERGFIRPSQAQIVVWLTITLMAAGQLLTVATRPKDAKLAGMYLTIIASVWAAAAWFVYALLYTGREERVTPRLVGLLSVSPLVATVLVPLNGLYYPVLSTPTTMVTGGSRTVLAFGWGPGVWACGIHNWVVSSGTIWLLVQKFLASRNVYRTITFLKIVGGSVLVWSPLVEILELSPFRYLLLGPVLFLVFAVTTVISLGSYRILQLIPLQRLLSLVSSRWQSLTPMARDTIIETMQSGVLVLDENNRIVDINPIGKRMIGAENRQVVGKGLTDVVPTDVFETEDTSFFDPETTEGEYEGIWVETADGQRYCYDLEITELSGNDDSQSGRTILVKDVTEREQRKRRLKRQNEQLDEFAGIVSHDLRNPLNVARGHLGIATESCDHDSLDEVEHSLDRMETIIDDVLALARQGQSISDTETVSLDEIAKKAWEHVDTPSMELEIVETNQFEADPDRLLQLFENLFRNAREHAGPDVTVTVGTEEGTFFVEDDGPGIPEDDRDDVLDSGYTTAAEGTGFGLAIVSEIAAAHGWSVTVTEAEAGGARFEFTRQSSTDEQEPRSQTRPQSSIS
jgi:PAS domain S-box-containing protein